MYVESVTQNHERAAGGDGRDQPHDRHVERGSSEHGGREGGDSFVAAADGHREGAGGAGDDEDLLPKGTGVAGGDDVVADDEGAAGRVRLCEGRRSV